MAEGLPRGWRRSARGGVHLRRRGYVAIVNTKDGRAGYHVFISPILPDMALEDALADAEELLERLPERRGSFPGET